MTDHVASWLVTYAAHSTALLAAALLVAKFTRTERAKEIVWKAALLGALASTTAPALLHYRPLLGSLEAPPRVRPAPAFAPDRAFYAGVDGGAISMASDGGASVVMDDVDRTADPRSAHLMDLSIAMWAAVAATLLLIYVGKHLRLRWILRDRATLTAGRQAAMLSELSTRAKAKRPVRLSVHPDCPVPIALSPCEVCVPTRFVTDLAPDEQEAVLAHELAHVLRDDPIWNTVWSVLQRVFFFQPLNAVGRCRWGQASEYLCDSWAAGQTGKSLSLARSLVHVGSWIASTPRRRAGLTMAAAGSSLVSRIERLIGDRTEPADRSPGARHLLAVGSIAFMTLVAPTLNPSPETLDADFRWAGVVAPEGAIEIKVPTGDIRVTTSSGDSVIVRAFAGGRDYATVGFERVVHGKGVTICAIFPPAAGMSENTCEPGRWRTHSSDAKVRVDFEVRVPAGARIVARTMTGDIIVDGSVRDVLARTTTGDVEMTITDASWTGSLDAANTSGDMVVRLPRGVAVHARANSDSGRVTTTLPVGGSNARRLPNHVEGAVGIGTAGGRVMLSSVWGTLWLQDGSGD